MGLSWPWRFAITILAAPTRIVECFSPLDTTASVRLVRTECRMAKARGPRAIQIGNDNAVPKPMQRKNRVRVSELQKNLLEDPSAVQMVAPQTKNKKKKSKRTHRKAEHPQQTYVYAWQKRLNSTNVVQPQQSQASILPRQTACDPPCPFDRPVLRHEIVLDGNHTTKAYILEKPSGWAILGNHPKITKEQKEEQKEELNWEQLEGKRFDRVVATLEPDILALMTPEELEAEGLETSELEPPRTWEETDIDFFEDEDESTTVEYEQPAIPNICPETEHNLRRIQNRLNEHRGESVFATQPIQRPSLTAWLKEYILETTGKTTRGGTYWKAIAGATAIDDSGLVLVAPRSLADEVFVEAASYLAVGSSKSDQCKTIATLRANRNDDVLQVMDFDNFVEKASTCDDVERLCDTVRGGESLERKAPRRLIHCQRLSVSTEFSFADTQTETIPDDIQMYTERAHSLFTKGSFWGRESLRANHTTAYREINGAGDGYPGWTVDRYGQWLVVYHQPEYPQGPLPSIHDGFTAGVYYVEKSQTGQLVRPRLLEGKAAPETFEVLENGVKYVVSLHHDFSTGIFLDQRPQRTWLTQQCNNSTRVLNTFAHTGAFGVAAAVAGASTVNIDLNRKWLDRFPLHLEQNGIEYDERHDCIFGDCFEWLQKLIKRGEQYDVVILDPPSSSIGGRGRRRWSITSDMDELVALAVQLVSPGGFLWTTTNCASLPISKFAKMVQKGAPHAQLERIQPMPVDFPTVGPQNVKNLVWRIPVSG